MRLAIAAEKFKKEKKESSKIMTAQQKRYEHKTNRVHHNRPHKKAREKRTEQPPKTNQQRKRSNEPLSFPYLFYFILQ